jgi:hypothetical protein
MRISESTLRRIIREEFIRVESESSDAKSSLNEGVLSWTLSKATGINSGALDILIPMFKVGTTAAVAVAKVREAVQNVYGGDAKKLAAEVQGALTKLESIKGVLKPLVTNKMMLNLVPVVAGIRELARLSANTLNADTTIASIKAFISSLGAKTFGG